MAAQRSSSKSLHQTSLSDIVGSLNESFSTRAVPTPSKQGRTTNVFAELFSRASSSQPRVIAPQLLLGTRSGTPKENPPPPLFRLKLVYSYVIEVADSEYQLLFSHKLLVSEILLFLRIRVSYIYAFCDLF